MAACCDIEGVGDLLQVEGGGGNATYALYAKQIQSMGCPFWKRNLATQVAGARLQALSIIVSITVMFGTDSGGDEDKTKKMVAAACEDDASTFTLGGACLLHQYHLMVQRSLKFSDTFCKVLEPAMNAKRKYFSSVVKLLHCWRDYSQKIYSRWAALYGVASASQFARARPPQALSGRWGAVEAAEARILVESAGQLRALLQRRPRHLLYQ